jgi:putative membrane protein insertion efficiency factor
MKTIISLPKLAAIFLINLYQATLSPDHGLFRARHPYGFCGHYPSCSQYAKEAIGHFGLLRGGWRAAKRIARCNPWAEPSVDPVKERAQIF